MAGLRVQKTNTKIYSFAFKQQVLDFQKRHQLSYQKTALYFNIPTTSALYSWQKTLTDNAISQSISRKGNCLDNAAMESFFHIMKAEVMTTHYQTKPELVAAMKKWIHYYNND